MGSGAPAKAEVKAAKKAAMKQQSKDLKAKRNERMEGKSGSWMDDALNRAQEEYNNRKANGGDGTRKAKYLTAATKNPVLVGTVIWGAIIALLIFGVSSCASSLR